MNTLFANLIAAARRLASRAAALDASVERIGSATVGGADFAMTINQQGHYPMLNAQHENTQVINHNPIPSYPLSQPAFSGAWRKVSKHPGATLQVAGGYT